MTISDSRLRLSLYVDHASRQWIVRDTDGELWIVVPDHDAWNLRRRFTPTSETELEVIPRHYLHLLGLPG